MTRGLFASLRFEDPALEADFRAHDCMATAPIARYCYFTGCFLWAGFGAVDVMLAPDHLGALWTIRFGVGLPTLVLAFLATYVERFQRNLKLLGVGVTLICGGSIIAMTAVLDSPVADSYYVGLILVLFCSYIFAQLRFFQAMFSSLLLLATYELVLVLGRSSPLDIVINNSAFVASTIYIGMFTCYKLEQHRRNEYQYTRTIEEQSSRDALTGLLNRRQLAAAFDAALARFVAFGESCAVLLIDVDDFKPINDRFGHDVGDDVLASVAARIRAALRSGDGAFRYGGDEFVVLLPGVAAVHSTITAARIRRGVTHWADGGPEPDRPAVSVSIGVTEIASRLDTLRTVMRLADEALYAAKSHGKCRVVIRPRSDRSGPAAAADGAS